jgi:hypothetical protein
MCDAIRRVGGADRAQPACCGRRSLVDPSVRAVVGFADEPALRGLVEEAPQLLPLSGAPQLVVVGREVAPGGGYADLLAVEAAGRLAVIEVKLARNPEARRAVVAQVLTYAAFLNGIDVATLERDVLGRQLRDRGYDSLAGAIAAKTTKRVRSTLRSSPPHWPPTWRVARSDRCWCSTTRPRACALGRLPRGSRWATRD